MYSGGTASALLKSFFSNLAVFIYFAARKESVRAAHQRRRYIAPFTYQFLDKIAIKDAVNMQLSPRPFSSAQSYIAYCTCAVKQSAGSAILLSNVDSYSVQISLTIGH